MKILVLNQGGRVLGLFPLSVGGTTSTTWDPRVILSIVLAILGACTFILAHNHRSGSLKPSKSDTEMTSRMQQSAAIMEVKFVDHLKITRIGFCSMADLGMM